MSESSASWPQQQAGGASRIESAGPSPPSAHEIGKRPRARVRRLPGLGTEQRDSPAGQALSTDPSAGGSAKIGLGRRFRVVGTSACRSVGIRRRQGVAVAAGHPSGGFRVREAVPLARRRDHSPACAGTSHAKRPNLASQRASCASRSLCASPSRRQIRNQPATVGIGCDLTQRLRRTLRPAAVERQRTALPHDSAPRSVRSTSRHSPPGPSPQASSQLRPLDAGAQCLGRSHRYRKRAMGARPLQRELDPTAPEPAQPEAKRRRGRSEAAGGCSSGCCSGARPRARPDGLASEQSAMGAGWDAAPPVAPGACCSAHQLRDPSWPVSPRQFGATGHEASARNASRPACKQDAAAKRSVLRSGSSPQDRICESLSRGLARGVRRHLACQLALLRGVTLGFAPHSSRSGALQLQ